MDAFEALQQGGPNEAILLEVAREALKYHVALDPFSIDPFDEDGNLYGQEELEALKTSPMLEQTLRFACLEPDFSVRGLNASMGAMETAYAMQARKTLGGKALIPGNAPHVCYINSAVASHNARRLHVPRFVLREKVGSVVITEGAKISIDDAVYRKAYTTKVPAVKQTVIEIWPSRDSIIDGSKNGNGQHAFVRDRKDRRALRAEMEALSRRG